MKRVLLALVVLFSVSLFAQREEAPYIFGSLGAKSGGGATNPYQQKSGSSVVLSTGFGLPLFSNISLYTRLSYISKSNYVGEEYANFSEGGLTTLNQLTSVNASFSQFIFNGGLQYNILLSNDLTMGVSGGVTYALVDHEAVLPNGMLLQKLDNEGVFGAFSGVSLEKSFEDSNVSLFGEAQYNYAKKDIIYFRDKFSGMNFTVGGRFYLND